MVSRIDTGFRRLNGYGRISPERNWCIKPSCFILAFSISFLVFFVLFDLLC